MIKTKQDIHIEETAGGEFVAKVPKIRAAVTGATRDEALNKAQRAIMDWMIAEAEKRKRWCCLP